MILTKNKITEESETYSKNVLLLFLPFRRESDLKYLGSYTLKLRIVYNSNRLKDKHVAFLQNIQDTKYNSFKIMNVRDHLQRITNPFQFNTTQDTNTTNSKEEDISDKEENFLEGEQLDTMINSFSTETSNNITANNNIPQKLNLEYIKSKGSHKCGFKDIASIDPNNDNVDSNLIQDSNNQQLQITN